MVLNFLMVEILSFIKTLNTIPGDLPLLSDIVSIFANIIL